NVLQLPFDREQFDIVIAINVMMHMRPYGIRKALPQMLRVVRAGGFIGVSDNLLVPWPRSQSHAVLRDALAEEACEVVYERGRRRFDMWIRKTYPIPPP
ncbi:MAG: class I SAM-dependent methyltransferase, partial [Acidobacteriota bacterium]